MKDRMRRDGLALTLLVLVGAAVLITALSM